MNVFEMSDEEIMSLTGPPELPEEKEDEAKVEEPAAENAPQQEQEDEPTEEETEGEDGPQEPNEDSDDQEPQEEGDSDPEPQESPFEGSVSEEAAAEKSDEKEPAESEEPQAETVDYEAFFRQVTAPFKANGEQIQVQSAEDIIRLMQQGANYTKKMQEISRHRKHLLMLQNNGLLDEQKLSFLIDLDKKNPEAIKKLLKDAGIDPIDLDVSEEPKYEAGRHVVSDQEAEFVATIEEVMAFSGGRETVQSARQWDPASQRLLAANPQVLYAIHEQRQNGDYAKIAAEINRRQILGILPATTPFLVAYEHVGNELLAQGTLSTVPAQPASPAQSGLRTPVARKVQKSAKPQVDTRRAKAAASPRTASKGTKREVNPLELSDEEFEKQFNQRFNRI